MFKTTVKQYHEDIPTPDNNAERALDSKMDNFRFETLGYFQVLDQGTYYHPAWRHYNRKTSVFCDRCNRQNLQACIGWQNFDLCLLCVDELTRLNFDCPSRHCHESKFINDNSMQFENGNYVDLNRYLTYQKYKLPTAKEYSETRPKLSK